MIWRTGLIVLFAAIVTLRTASGDEPVAKPRHPNIVVILADDFGVGDIQAHYPKNKIRTPQLDRLVSQGMSFTDAHSPSSCCTPTRYGILTGRYAWRTRLQEWVLAPYEPPLIAEGRPTLPRMLQQKGYRTACVGKWHLGWQWPGKQKNRMDERRYKQAFMDWEFEKPIGGGPITHGFDEYFGVDVPNFPPFTYIEQDRVVAQPSEKYRVDDAEGVFLPKAFNGTAAAPNWKLTPILPTLTQKATEFIHKQAQQDHPFFLYFPLTSPHTPVVPTKDFRGASGIAPIADFVMQTDWTVGQVLKAIDDAGIAEETIVIFTADNGHAPNGWQDLIDAGHLPSGPYRGRKGDVWEGGHRIPLVVRWPNRIAAGSQSNQLVSLTDLFATCAELISEKLPEDGAEDSTSFLAAALGKSGDSARTSAVLHSSLGEFAYREGKWKLVYKIAGSNLDKSRGKRTIAELYDLENDIAERHDLAKEHPELVSRLTSDLDEVIKAGSSRRGQSATNDRLVRFDITQSERWGAAAQSAKSSSE